MAAADYVQAAAGDQQALVDQGAGLLLYHYYPPMEQVRAWFDQAGLVIEEEGLGDGYAHLILRKR